MPNHSANKKPIKSVKISAEKKSQNMKLYFLFRSDKIHTLQSIPISTNLHDKTQIIKSPIFSWYWPTFTNSYPKILPTATPSTTIPRTVQYKNIPPPNHNKTSKTKIQNFTIRFPSNTSSIAQHYQRQPNEFETA